MWAGLGCAINSFPAETPVHALDEHDQPRLIPISQLKIGDKVLAKSEWKAEAESLSYEPITDVLITPNSPRTLVHLTLADGQTLTATDGHPLRTTKGWRDAILLKKGGKLLLKDSGDAEAELGAGLAADSAAEKAGIKGAAANTATPRTLKIIDVRHSRETLTTYNLEVANAHTFFVGEDGVLVHNAGRIPMRPKSKRSPADKTPGNNQAQNAQFNDACNVIGRGRGRKLDKKERGQLHNEITGRGLSREEIINEGKGMFP